MKGNILSYGVISGQDGNRYTFDALDIKNLGNKNPMKLDGSEVDFEIEDKKAINIYITKSAGVSLESLGDKIGNINASESIQKLSNSIKNFDIDAALAFIKDNSLAAIKQKGLISAASAMISFLTFKFLGVYSFVFVYIAILFASFAMWGLFRKKLAVVFVILLGVLISFAEPINAMNSGIGNPIERGESVMGKGLATSSGLWGRGAAVFNGYAIMSVAGGIKGAGLVLMSVIFIIALIPAIILSLKMLKDYRAQAFMLFCALILANLFVGSMLLGIVAYCAYIATWYMLKDPKNLLAQR